MYCAIDIGGTKTEVALFENKELASQVATFTIPTSPEYASGKDQLFREIDAHMSGHDFTAVGISFPGIVNPDGTIIQASNIPDYAGKPLIQDFEAKFNAPVRIVQDAACSAVAEYVYGDIAQYKKVVHLIMGTGIGGSIIDASRGEIHITPMEPGGMIVVFGGRDHDVTNTKGLLEAYVGGGNIEDHYKLNLADVPNDDKLWGEITDYLAAGINNLNCILRPEAVIVGGGIGIKRQAALESVMEKIKPYNEFVEPPIIEFTKVDGNSSLIGALALNFVDHLTVNP